MVLNFGLAAGVLYATRKSKLKFKEKLKKQYDEKVLMSRDLVLYSIPYFKIVIVLILVLVQIWVHRVIQKHKEELDQIMGSEKVIVKIASETALGSLSQASKSLFLEEVIGHIFLTLVSFIQFFLIKIERLSVSEEEIKLKIYSLTGVKEQKFKVANVKDVRVLRKGKDRISHKTEKFSIRVYSEAENERKVYFDFYQTASAKVAKMVYVQIIAALRMEFDACKAYSIVKE